MMEVDEQIVPPALRLASTQLAEVLRRVPQAERLRHCALVCRGFQHAAVLATGQVTITARDRHAAACSWLQAHGLAASVSSISVQPGVLNISNTDQQLPWDQLPVLQQLTLSHINIPALPVPVLSCLTHLHLEDCRAAVDSLAAYTQLQHLALEYCSLGVPNSDEAAAQLFLLRKALPTLQHLTHLSLSDQLATDETVVALQQLPRLQDLQLHRATCSEASFSVLPMSLTSLEVYCVGVQRPPLSKSSAPGLAQLSALQRLVLAGADTVRPALLAALPSLRHLEVSSCVLAAGPDEAGWYVLRRLSRLQHLALTLLTTTGQDPATAPRLTAADAAALTASTQLNFLDISSGTVRENDFQAMFPIGKVLSHLQQVHASMDILAWLYQISMCCPNVELLHMREAAAGDGALSDFQDYEFARYLGDLTLFKKLTALELNLSVPGAGRGEDAPVVWDALAELTRLRSLGLWGVAWDSVHGVLQLTALQSLTHLQVAARDPAHSWGDRTTFSVADEAPDGSPSDVWYRMPQKLLQEFQEHVHREGAWDGSAIASMLQAAAAATAHAINLHHQKQQEVRQLKQQLANMQQQMGTLQQQVQAMSSAMQARVDTVAAQLQVMQLQQQQQQQQQEL